MKKLLKTILVLLLFVPFIIKASTKNITMYLFYGDGCPHCKALEEYFEDYLKTHKNIEIKRYEVWHNDENVAKLRDIIEIMDTSDSGIPYLVIGKTVIVGFDSKYTPDQIDNAVSYYSKVGFKDVIGSFIDGSKTKEEIIKEKENDNKEEEYKDEEINIPIIGKRKKSEVPLLLSSVVIGLVDGFNPCAMWILLFLISMLIGMKNKKRRWILGIAFLSASALVYFLFLLSWLELATFLTSIVYVRVGIACAAITLGILSIVRFLKGLLKDDGCEVVDTKNRKRIVVAIKKIVKEESFILAIIGIILLAFSVNIIELLCSLGLPVMFSEILAINNVSGHMKIIYSLIYVFFFLIDDIIIFVIAMKTLEIKAISNKFGKYSHLVGGIIMLLIGILMLYKPEWLMFNFK